MVEVAAPAFYSATLKDFHRALHLTGDSPLPQLICSHELHLSTQLTNVSQVAGSAWRPLGRSGPA